MAFPQHNSLKKKKKKKIQFFVFTDVNSFTYKAQFPYFLADVNECNGENACDHVCHNTVGSYYCSCKKGYALAAGNKKCVGERLIVVDKSWFRYRYCLTE